MSKSTKLECQIGATMSDMVAMVHGLVTEDEKGEMLKQRIIDIRATANSIILRAEAIAKERSNV
jgi:hypothetical protein